MQKRHTQARPFDPAEAGRVENVLAAGRVILAATAALTIYAAPTGPTAPELADYAWPAGYILFSLAVVFLRPAGSLLGALPILIQMVDILWISVLARMGSAIPSLALFTFALVSAAYRWNPWTTIANGVAIAGLELLPLVPEETFSLASGTIFFARTGYLMAMSVVLGYLFDNERRLHNENALIARSVDKAKAELSLSVSAVGVLWEMRSFYRAESILFVAEELATGVPYILELSDGEPPSGRFVQLDASQRPIYLYPLDAECWHSTSADGVTHKAVCLDAQGNPGRLTTIRYPEELVARRPFRSLLGAKVQYGQELVGRVFVFDPRLRVERARELVFLQRFINSVMSAVYNVYLWRRLRERAGALERARVARDLHDGLIQSLIGLEMRLNTMRSQASTGHVASAAEIEPLQQVLRDEIRMVRDLMNRLREPDVGPSELVSFMSKQVDKFAEETGIAARFVAETNVVALPAEVCQEVVQILQEALTNVRKHSGAKELLVRLSAPESGLHLAIIDNGKGFDFKGRLSHAELRAMEQGPRVIKERVQLIHGELEIESVPGHGARLDVRLPKKLYA